MVKHAPEERMKTVRFCPAAHNKNRRTFGDFCFSVGLLGIEPSLPVPKTGVLPVYDSPVLAEHAHTSHFNLSYFWFRINAN